MDYKKKFVKNNIIVFLSQSGTYIWAIVLLPLLVKTIGPAAYGGYVLVSSFVVFLYGISSLGANFNFKRFIPAVNAAEERCKYFYPQFFFQLASIMVISAILLASKRLIEPALLKMGIVFFLPLTALVLLGYFMMQQSNYYFRYTHRMGISAKSMAIYPYLTLLLLYLIIVMKMGVDINTIFISEIIVSFLIGTILLVMIVKEIGYEMPLACMRSITDSIRLGFPLTLLFVIDFILIMGDRYVIGLYLSTLFVGYYNAAYMIALMVLIIPKILDTTLLPLFASAIDNHKTKDADTLIESSIKIFLMVAVPFIAASIVLSTDILTFMTSRAVADAAAPCVTIMAVSNMFLGLNLILANILFVRMKTKATLFANSIAAVFDLTASIILLYFFRNIFVVACAKLLSYLIAFIMLRRQVGISMEKIFEIRFSVKCAIACIPMCIVLILVRRFTNNIFITIPAGVVIYFAGITVLKIFGKKEMRYITSVFRRDLEDIQINQPGAK